MFCLEFKTNIDPGNPSRLVELIGILANVMAVWAGFGPQSVEYLHDSTVFICEKLWQYEDNPLYAAV